MIVTVITLLCLVIFVNKAPFTTQHTVVTTSATTQNDFSMNENCTNIHHITDLISNKSMTAQILTVHQFVKFSLIHHDNKGIIHTNIFTFSATCKHYIRVTKLFKWLRKMPCNVDIFSSWSDLYNLPGSLWYRTWFDKNQTILKSNLLFCILYKILCCVCRRRRVNTLTRWKEPRVNVSWIMYNPWTFRDCG